MDFWAGLNRSIYVGVVGWIELSQYVFKSDDCVWVFAGLSSWDTTVIYFWNFTLHRSAVLLQNDRVLYQLEKLSCKSCPMVWTLNMKLVETGFQDLISGITSTPLNCEYVKYRQSSDNKEYWDLRLLNSQGWCWTLAIGGKSILLICWVFLCHSTSYLNERASEISTKNAFCLMWSLRYMDFQELMKQHKWDFDDSLPQSFHFVLVCQPSCAWFFHTNSRFHHDMLMAESM